MTGSPIEPTDPAFRAALWAFRSAQNPVQRTSALFLMSAQRCLAAALASSPAQIADDPNVTDPEADYVSWLEWMTTAERQARAEALRSAEEGRRRRAGRGQCGEPVDSYTDAVYRRSIDRAIAAIDAMAGGDPAAAAAAIEGICSWHNEDQDAEIAFVLDYTNRVR